MEQPKISLHELARTLRQPQNPSLLRGGDYSYQDPDTGDWYDVVECVDPDTGETIERRVKRASLVYL